MALSKTIFLMLVILVAGSLVACSTPRGLAERPIPTNFKAESMMKLQSVSHWNNVAVDMAADVAKKYASGYGCIPGTTCQTAIYVQEPAYETQFSKAFHTQLVSALVNRGQTVLVKSQPAITTVLIDIQVIGFSRGRTEVEYDRKPTELVNGVWVIRDLPDTAVHKLKTLNTNQWSEGETSNNEWFRSPHFTPAAEMLVTVSFVKDQQYMARTSNVYYMDSEYGYVPTISSLEKGGTPRSTEKTWNMSVEGDCTAPRCVTK